MKKIVLFVFLFLLSLALVLLTPLKSYVYWLVVKDIAIDTTDLPLKNREVINFIELKGKSLAPSYEKVVCTEYVINVLGNFKTLTNHEKSTINIITKNDLGKLILNDSDIIKGVSYCLTNSGRGISIKEIKDARPGDFIQFWNTRFGKITGHCGIIRGVDIGLGLISLYSSSPSTDGYGKQIYVMPDKYYIARLK